MTTSQNMQHKQNREAWIEPIQKDHDIYTLHHCLPVLFYWPNFLQFFNVRPSPKQWTFGNCWRKPKQQCEGGQQQTLLNKQCWYRFHVHSLHCL